MEEIYPNLFVGDEEDYELKVKGKDGWAVVHACKEPYHRRTLGYTGRGAPKDHPEYLIAKRGDRLILNLIDPDDPNYIPEVIIDESLAFVEEKLKDGKKVLIHCNQGESRSPSIGLLYLAQNDQISNDSFESAKKDFQSIYPKYNPGLGFLRFLRRNWDEYVG